MISHRSHTPSTSAYAHARTEQRLQVRARPAPVAPQPVEVIAQAVLAIPGVQGLHAGKDHVVTHLPSRQVRGIREAAYGFEVHVVLVRDCPLLLTVEAVRAAVQAVAPGRVDVTVESVARRRAGSR